MLSGHLDYFQKPPLGGRPNSNPGDHGTPNVQNFLFSIFIMLKDLHEKKLIEIAFGGGSGHIRLHTTFEDP